MDEQTLQVKLSKVKVSCGGYHCKGIWKRLYVVNMRRNDMIARCTPKTERSVQITILHPFCIIGVEINTFLFPPLSRSFSPTDSIFQCFFDIAHAVLYRELAFIPPFKGVRSVMPGRTDKTVGVEDQLEVTL